MRRGKAREGRGRRGGRVKSVNTVYVASSEAHKGFSHRMKGSVTTQECVSACVYKVVHPVGLVTNLSPSLPPVLLPPTNARSVTLPLPLTWPRPCLHTTERVAFPKVDPGAFIQLRSCRDVCLFAARLSHLLIRGAAAGLSKVPNCCSLRPKRLTVVHGKQAAQSHISHQKRYCSQPEGKRRDGAAEPSLFGTLTIF